MRTNLTLDADVCIELEALRRKQGFSLKDAVNDALRRGFRAMAEGNKPTERFVTRSANLGLPHLPLDDMAAALAASEGETFR